MTRKLVTLLIAACAALGVGCGAQSTGDDASIVITRDFGTEVVAAEQATPVTEGLTAMRQLQATHKVENGFGGRYVNSINGLEEDSDSAWLFYVDGIESQVGATSVRLKPNQVLQWDFHPWQTVKGGGAIVGAYPRPLVNEGVQLICVPRVARACAVARRGLEDAGVKQNDSSHVRVVVGPWSSIDSVTGVPDLTAPGESNGAYASFSSDGTKLTPVRADGSEGVSLGLGNGLLAAFATGDQVTWVVTGTNPVGAERAGELLGRSSKVLTNRFAMIASGGSVTPLPQDAGN